MESSKAFDICKQCRFLESPHNLVQGKNNSSTSIKIYSYEVSAIAWSEGGGGAKVFVVAGMWKRVI